MTNNKEDLAISLENVTYVYPTGHVALNDVSLDAKKGESIAILGENGAGKSTLILHLNGILQPKKGRVIILGKKTSKKENLRFIRKNVGIVMQDPDEQLFMPTLRQDMEFGLLNLGFPRDEIEERIIKTARELDLEKYLDTYPHHLSTGERKKAALATILVLEPRILVLDEPLANLDPMAKRAVINLIKKLKSKDITLIIATHEIEHVPRLADRVILMKNGKIVADGETREILTNTELMHQVNLYPPMPTRIWKQLHPEPNMNGDEPVLEEELVELVKGILLDESMPNK